MEPDENTLYSYQYISTSSGGGYKLYVALEQTPPYYYEIGSLLGSSIAYVPSGGGGSGGGSGSSLFIGYSSIGCSNNIYANIGYDIKELDDGYLITGHSRCFLPIPFSAKVNFLTKINKDNSLSFVKTYSPSESGNFIYENSLGEFIIAGIVPGPGAGNDDIILMKFDSNLNYSGFSRRIHGSDKKAESLESFEKVNNGYLISCLSNVKTTILKINDVFNSIIFAKRINFGYEEHINKVEAEETLDGGYIVVADPINDNPLGMRYVLIISKISSDGTTIEWSKLFIDKNNGHLRLKTMLRDSNNNYIIGITGFSLNYMVLLKINSSGVVEWMKSLRGAGEFNLGITKIHEIPNGYIISASVCCVIGMGSYESILIKTDSNVNNVDWAKSIGTINREESKSVDFLSDGGYAMTGYVDNGKLMFAKFDSYGEIENCSNLNDISSYFYITDKINDVEVLNWLGTTTITDVASNYSLVSQNIQVEDYTASTTDYSFCSE